MRPIVGNLLRSRFQIYILLSIKNLSFFYINSLIMLTILAKIYLNSLLHEYFQNYLFFDLYLFTYTNPFLLKSTWKKTFFQLFFYRYCCFRRFFFLKGIHLTFPAANFAHHATYGWKALEEKIPNIYTFIGQKLFFFK